jgi:hypothetical protein
MLKPEKTWWPQELRYKGNGVISDKVIKGPNERVGREGERKKERERGGEKERERSGGEGAYVKHGCAQRIPALLYISMYM